MLKYSMLGFDISATDIRIKTESKKIDQNNTRIDFPLMVAKNEKVSNGLLTNLAYNDVDMSSIYAIYNPNTYKLSSSATADLLKTNSTFF